jgi:hypothetical protein
MVGGPRSHSVDSAPPELSDAEVRHFYWKLRQRKSNSTLWQSHNSRRPQLARRRMMRSMARSPVIAMHIAALVIQRAARGYLLRVAFGTTSGAPQVPRASKRTAAAAQAFKTSAVAEGGGMGGMTPADAAAAKAASAQSTELSLVARYLEAKVRHGGPPAGGAGSEASEEVQFNDWILLRLQAYARMVPHRAYRAALRLQLFNAAAASIQRARRARDLILPPGASAAGRKKRRGPPSRGRAAFLIQRAWRGFTNRRIFGYLREMLLFREQGDARELLRCINPREAALIDPATAIHVRFRLGGHLFPPAIYYKVYTHAPVTDIGAFAPRDYTAHFQPPPIAVHNHGRSDLLKAAAEHSGWYRRSENNGWRPIAGETLGDLETTARTSRPIVWHHDKMVRKEEAQRKRKERKRQWMRQMYALGKSGAGEAGGPGGGGGQMGGVGADGGPMLAPPPGYGGEGRYDSGYGEGYGEEDEEEDLDALLQWSDGLDFDSYHADWLALATSSRPEWAKMGTAADTEFAGVAAP